MRNQCLSSDTLANENNANCVLARIEIDNPVLSKRAMSEVDTHNKGPDLQQLILFRCESC